MDKVWAVIVTYNRKELLKECVSAILRTDIFKILVIDNASSDGTENFLLEDVKYKDERIVYIRLKSNEGGAGGFYWGTRYAYEHGADWVWLMDDDVEPLPGALESLLGAIQRPNIGFACSCVRTPDLANSMNLPLVASSASIGKYPSWDQWLNEGIVKVKAATFVSVMISREAIAKCGFPNRKFFIWGDDLEYTERITSSGYTGIFVGKSVVLHKRAQLEALSIITEKNQNRIKMMINMYQNTTWVKIRGKNIINISLAILKILRDAALVLIKSDNNKILRLNSIFGGAWRAFTRNLSNESNWKLSEAVDPLYPPID